MSREVSGFVEPGFEGVREAFVQNLERRNELGAACCVYFRGNKVVDLWGGIRDRATSEPWEEDTMVLVFSTTKGMAGLSLALANSRGLLSYDELVSEYWPEFARNGKEKITVRHLLSHQAGLFAFDRKVDKETVANPDKLASILADQRPAWEPGTRQAYHAISLGFYEGELIRRVDPRHRTLGQFFHDEIAGPLGLDFFISLPESVPDSRLAKIEKFGSLRGLLSIRSLPFLLASMNRNSPTFRAMFVNPGPWLALDDERVYARNLEVPSAGGVGTARAIARAYGAYANGGAGLSLRKETLDALMSPGVPPIHGFRDEVTKREMVLSLGFLKPNPVYPFGNSGSFGAPGAGGSFGFADPEAKVAYAYVCNRMGAKQGGDPREVAIRTAMHKAVSKSR